MSRIRPLADPDPNESLSVVEWTLCQKEAAAVRIISTPGHTSFRCLDEFGDVIRGCRLAVDEQYYPLGTRTVPVVPGGSAPGMGDAAAALARAPSVSEFSYTSYDFFGNPDGGYTASIKPIPIDRFVSILTDSTRGYERFVALFDDDTRVTGSSASDRFEVGAGDDVVRGGDGSDVVHKWKRGDLDFDGGDGFDSLYFNGDHSSATFPTPFTDQLVLDLKTGRGTSPYGGKLELKSVEIIHDTSAADVIRGSNRADTVVSDSGGRDTFVLRGGDDTFSIHGNLDSTIDGGEGFDTLNVWTLGFGSPVTESNRLDLTDPSRNTGSFEGAKIRGVESFTFSPLFGVDLEFIGTGKGERVAFSSFSLDSTARLVLGGGNDEGIGGAGADTILGGGGRDILQGGGGDDFMNGGAQNDRFRFGAGFGNDTIAGFDTDGDRLDFSQHFGVTGMRDLDISRQGDDTLVEAGVGESILLLDAAPHEIDRGDFIFA